jgi:hypothetical protein
MGTGNFHNVNARNVYAVLMNYERHVLDEYGDETLELEECAPDSWECQDFFDNFREDAQELAPTKGFSYHNICDPDPHELRSHGSHLMFQFYKNKKFGDVDVTVNINCVVRGAYYEGASLDWYITYDACGVNMNQIDFPYFKRFTEKKLFPEKKAPQKIFLDQIPKEKIQKNSSLATA